MRQQGPTLLREQPHEVSLDLLGSLLLGEGQECREPLHVGVDHDPSIGDSESIAQVESHSRSCATGRQPGSAARQLLHGARNLAIVVRAVTPRSDFLRKTDDIFRLVSEESGGADDLLHILPSGKGRRDGLTPGVLVPLKEEPTRRPHHVHPLRRSSGPGENGRHDPSW